MFSFHKRFCVRPTNNDVHHLYVEYISATIGRINYSSGDVYVLDRFLRLCESKIVATELAIWQRQIERLSTNKIRIIEDAALKNVNHKLLFDNTRGRLYDKIKPNTCGWWERKKKTLSPKNNSKRHETRFRIEFICKARDEKSCPTSHAKIYEK